MSKKRLIVGPSFPVLLDRMTDEVLGSRKAHPLDPELVVVPDVPLARFVESHLAAHAASPMVNLQVMPLWLVPKRMVSRDMSVPSPCHRAMLRLACDYVLTRAATQNALARRFKHLAGIEESLLKTFNELLEAGIHDPAVIIDYLESASVESEIGRTTLMLFAAWLEALRSRDLWPNQLIVSQARFELPVARIHVFGFTHVSGIWHDFIDALAGANPGLDVLFYYPYRTAADKGSFTGYEFATREIEERMGALPIEESDAPIRDHPVAAEIDQVQSLIVSENEAELPAAHAVQIISAAGETGEVEATAREIMRLIRESPFEQRPEAIAVLARDLDRYVPVIQRVFKERDIPISWLKPLRPIHHPVVRWLQSMLALPARRFKRGDVVGIFLSPFLRIPRESSQRAFQRLEQRLLELCITSFDDDMWSARTRDDVDCDWRDTVADFVRDLRELSNAETGSAFHERLLDLLRTWVRGDLLEEDAVLGPWLRQLEWLSHVDDLAFCSGGRIGDTLLQLAIDGLTRLPLTEPAPRGRGVTVGRVDEAMGMSFEVVFLLGVNRGEFPKRAREDPLLPDTERSRLFNVLGYPLAIKANEHEHEKLLFLLTVLAATSRLFVLHRHSSYTGKPESGSLFIPLFLGERALERTRVIPSNLEQELQSVAMQEQPPLTLREAMILTANAPQRTSEKAKELAEYTGGRFWELLRNAQRVAKDRNGRSISSYDFAAGSIAATRERSLRIAGAWQDLEKCPYRFFLARILRIPRLEQPETLWSLSILDEGSIVHKFFERLFHEGIPEPGDEGEVLEKAFREAVAWYHASHPEADLSALSEYQISRTKAWLLPVAEQEVALIQREREESGFPDRILVEYTPPHASLECTTGDGNRVVTIPLSIRVDRLDLGFDENGQMNRGRLIDYKVRSRETSRGRDAENLQLYLYAESLALPGVGRPDAAYVEFFSGRGPDTVTTLSQKNDDEALAKRHKEKAAHLIGHLKERHTRFFLTANRGHECSWCDYRWYCKRYDFVLARKSDEASTAFFEVLKDLNRELRHIQREATTERYR